MKKYSSGSFIDAAVRVYGSEADTISSFPASIIANGGNITPWAVYGNTVEGTSVGEKTANLFDKDSLTKFGASSDYSVSGATITMVGTSSAGNYYYNTALLPAGNYTLTFSTESTTAFYMIMASNSDLGNATINNTSLSANQATIAANLQMGYARFLRLASKSLSVSSDVSFIICFAPIADEWIISNVMLNSGSTALSYEPYGYKLPVVIGSNTTNIYMADVLRMSSGADPVYDIMSSTGVITRNVDTDGTPLITPTTESFTAPTLATVAGSQSVSFDTTVKPSKAELTYTGWHTHSDKKRSGGAWT